MQAQLDSWDTVMEGLLQDEFFAKVVDSQKAWSERVAFYDLMNQADYKLAYEHYFPGKLSASSRQRRQCVTWEGRQLMLPFLLGSS